MSVEWGEALDFTVCNKQNHIIWMQVASREGGHHSACGTNSRSPWRFGSHGIAIFKNGFAPWVCMPCKGEKVNSFGIATEIKASIFFKVWLFLHTELGVCVLTLRLFVFHIWTWMLQRDFSYLGFGGCSSYTGAWLVHWRDLHHSCETRYRVRFFICFQKIGYRLLTPWHAVDDMGLKWLIELTLNSLGRWELNFPLVVLHTISISSSTCGACLEVVFEFEWMATCLVHREPNTF